MLGVCEPWSALRLFLKCTRTIHEPVPSEEKSPAGVCLTGLGGPYPSEHHGKKVNISMKVVALVSGGKDSCYNILKCKQHGHEVVALANLMPHEGAPDELDSYCFQTVGHQMLPLYPQCTGLPLYRMFFHGVSLQRELQYEKCEGDEVEDLFRLLAFVKWRHPDVQGVSSGAIASNYQRLRVEHVCCRLQMTSLTYLWHQPQAKLLQVQ
jgi:diphthine-ammonia ligase